MVGLSVKMRVVGRSASSIASSPGGTSQTSMPIPMQRLVEELPRLAVAVVGEDDVGRATAWRAARSSRRPCRSRTAGRLRTLQSGELRLGMPGWGCRSGRTRLALAPALEMIPEVPGLAKVKVELWTIGVAIARSALGRASPPCTAAWTAGLSRELGRSARSDRAGRPSTPGAAPARRGGDRPAHRLGSGGRSTGRLRCDGRIPLEGAPVVARLQVGELEAVGGRDHHHPLVRRMISGR